MARARIAFAVVISAVISAVKSVGASISISGVAGALGAGGRSASSDSDFAAIKSWASDAFSVSPGCAAGVSVVGAPASINRAAAGRATGMDV